MQPFSQIPKIIVGTARMGSVLPDFFASKKDEEKVFHYLDGVFEIGCTALDTAASYQVGGTERLLGKWLRSRRNRDQIFLISKGAHPVPILQPNRLSASALTHDLHHSLKRLQTDVLDLYLIHKDHPGVPLEPILEVMSGFQKSGKILAWGVSNWSQSRIQSMNDLAAKSGLPTIAASSPHFSLAEWVKMPWSESVSLTGAKNQTERKYYEQTQLPVFAWSPLGHGFFGAHPVRTYASPENFERKARAQKLADQYGVTAPQIALAYLFHQKFPVYAVSATSTVAKMKSNLDATKIQLTPKEVDWLGLVG